VPWVRLLLLVVSFSCLIAFGIQALRTQRRLKINARYIGIGLIVVYVVIVLLSVFTHQGSIAHGIQHADAWARYILAVPGALLAAIAMFYQSQTPLASNHRKLALSWKWAGVGFAIYSLTQAVVAPLDTFPASILNTEIFLNTLGFPVQVLRAGMALLITYSLIRAIQTVEEERRNQLEKAHQARVEALERMQQELVIREEMRRELLRHTVIAQEEERARIARELHDQTAQTLSAFSLNLATLQQACADCPEVNDLINQLRERCHEMSQGIYYLMHDLRPSQLDDLGLVPAIQQLADEGKENLGLEIEVRVSGNRMRLDPVVETAIYRIAQEALTNISRHAQTDRAMVAIIFEDERCTLQVQDMGIGFDVTSSLLPPRGWGLAGMRERSEAINGVFEIISTPGEGTLVEVTVPLEYKMPADSSLNSEWPASQHDQEKILWKRSA
jgi:signal transduction histidine kinase